MAFITSSLGTQIRVTLPANQRTTVINWDTEAGAGRMSRRVNGGQLQDWPDGIARKAFRANDTLNVGDVHEYVLFNLAQGVLASVTVSCRRAFDPGLADAEARATIEHFLANLGEVQQIRNVRVEAGPAHVDISFETTQPAIPDVVIATKAADFFAPSSRYRIDKDTVVGAAWPIFDGPRTRHSLRIRPLPFDSQLYFLISADDLDPSRRVAQRRGSFHTTTRDALVTLHRIIIHDDSDSGGLGEAGWLFQVYEGAQGRVRLTAYWDYLRIKSGYALHPEWEHRIPNVGDVLTLVVYGEDDDAPWGVNDLIDQPFSFVITETAPGPGHGSTALYDWARAQESVSLPDTVVGSDWTERVHFASPRGALHFSVEASVRVPATAMARIMDPPPPPSIPRVDYAHPGRRPAMIPGGDGLDLIAIGPAGTVLHSRERRESASNGPPWTAIGHGAAGSATALAAPTGETLVFALNEDGAVLHKAWTGEGWQPANGEWRVLGGGELRGRVVALQRSEASVDLFGVAGDGSVRHRRFALRDGSDDAQWTSLGGSVGSCLTPVASNGERIELFALAREGEVLHATMLVRAHGMLDRQWSSLGGRFAGPLIAHSEEDGVVDLFAVDRERRLWHRRWKAEHADPAHDEWKQVGELDALVEPRPVPAPTAEPATVHCQRPMNTHQENDRGLHQILPRHVDSRCGT